MSDTKQTSKLPGDEATVPEIPKSSVQPKWRPAPAEPEPDAEENAARAAQIKGNDVLYRLHREGKLGQGTLPSFPADGGETDLARDFDMALKEYTVERDDNLPLRFTGYLVGWNEVDLSVPRGTRVTIFVTRSNRVVTAVHQWQRGEKRERSRHDAGVHDGPEEALAWLIRDGGQQLGRSSREAWEMACQIWPAFKGHDVEVIDQLGDPSMVRRRQTRWPVPGGFSGLDDARGGEAGQPSWPCPPVGVRLPGGAP